MVVAYETILKKRKHFFEAVIHDYAQVFLDGVLIATTDRSESIISKFTADCQSTSCVMKIVV